MRANTTVFRPNAHIHSEMSLLIAGATGNTGVGVVRTLSSLNVGGRIIALTRHAQGSTAKALASLPGVDVVEKDWTMVDAAWLRDHDVKRIFIASHNNVSHFVDESLFLNYALEAGVEYTVRISTTKANVTPNSPAYYGRSHWAVEAMLATPEFKAMQWTSLQPNVFTQVVVPTMAAWLHEYRHTGNKGTFKTMIDRDTNIALVDSVEVGNVAGRLLALADVSAHNGQKYVVVGPSNVTGREQVALLEKLAGTTVDDVVYRDLSWVGYMTDLPANLVPSILLAPRSGYNGGSSLEKSPTSPAVLALCPPRHGALEQMEEMLRRV